MKRFWKLALPLTLLAAGCAAPKDSSVERGQYNTIAYTIAVDASEPGTKIEVNYQVVGTVPLTIKVFGDRDGTFHNFGNDEFVVRAYPPSTNQYPQTRIFKTGTFGIKDDKIPEKIFFQFDPIAR